MKMLVDRTPVGAAAPFSLPELKLHLRVTHDDEDTAILASAHTAAREVEHAAQIALLSQTIRVTVVEPEKETLLILPIGPGLNSASATVTIDGDTFSDFEFVTGVRPMIIWGEEYEYLDPRRITIEYLAGFGPGLSNVPADLAQAIRDQTAVHFDGRSPMDRKALTSSPHMQRIVARYRGVAA